MRQNYEYDESAARRESAERLERELTEQLAEMNAKTKAAMSLTTEGLDRLRRRLAEQSTRRPGTPRERPWVHRGDTD